MNKFFKNYWVLVILAVLLAVVISYLLLINKSLPNRINSTSSIQTPSVPTESISGPTSPLIPTSTSVPVGGQVNMPTAISNGPPQGQITCNYQIPFGPTTDGSAVISATWSNLIVGKNGSAQAAVCVQASGQASALMSLNDSASGSWENNISWLGPNTVYTFTLYDEHGGILGNCAGAVLSSCGISTMVPPTAAPGRPGGH